MVQYYEETCAERTRIYRSEVVENEDYNGRVRDVLVLSIEFMCARVANVGLGAGLINQ